MPDELVDEQRDRCWRIGVLGNTNNYPFMVCRALKRMGHDAVQFVDRVELLNRPEGRYTEFSNGYPSWIVDISGTPLIGSLKARQHRRDLLEQLRSFDFLIVNGIGPALAARSALPRYALLTGTDLENEADWSNVVRVSRDAFHRLGLPRGIAAFGFALETVLSQRKGIGEAFGVNYFIPGLAPAGDKILHQLGVSASRRSAFMITDVDADRVLRIEPRLRSDTSRLRIFNVARLNWQEPRAPHLSSLDMKGTDILLKGFALFVHQHRGRGELVLVRKGQDVAATEALVHELNLADHVIWLNEMSQAQVFDQYEQADVVAEQLSTSVIGMGGLDAMACARPVLANARPDVFEPMIGEPSPVLHATDESAVCQHLVKLQSDPLLAGSVGVRSRAYVRQHFSAEAAARHILRRWSAHRLAGSAHSDPRSNMH